MHTEHFIVLLLTLDPPRPQMECETLDKEMLDANPDIHKEDAPAQIPDARGVDRRIPCRLRLKCRDRCPSPSLERQFVEYWFAMMRVVVPRAVEVEPECVSRRFQDKVSIGDWAAGIAAGLDRNVTPGRHRPRSVTFVRECPGDTR